MRAAAPSAAQPSRLAFLFPGLGEHYPGMGAELYREEPVFRRTVDRASEVLAPIVGVDLRREIVSERAPRAHVPDLRRMLRRGPEPANDDRRLDETWLAHPAVFVVEYALAELYRERRIEPDAMLGYSLGEYVAAAVAGVLPFEDMLIAVAERARLIESLPRGAMLAVALPASQLDGLLGDGLSIAAYNGATMTVVGGANDAVRTLEAALLARGEVSRRLRTRHAFHTPMLRAASEPFAARLRRLSLGEPRIPFVSNVTGTWITGAQATDPRYWARHLVEPVRFGAGLAALDAGGYRTLIEVGPGQSLRSLALLESAGGSTVALASLPSEWEGGSELALLEATVRRVREPMPAAVAQRACASDPVAPSVEAASSAASTALAAPATDGAPDATGAGAKRVASIFAELLRAPRVALDDDFFALGGNSLLASRLAFRLRTTFGVDVSPRAVFDAPTPRRLALRVERSSRRGGRPEVDVITLPNGLEIEQRSPDETCHLFHDIFEERSYLRHGVTLGDGCCVFDVGANIGLFSLFVGLARSDARIYAFEPAPPLYATYLRNTRRHGVRARAFDFGLGREARRAPFTYYPRSSGMSSFFADPVEEVDVLRAIVRNQLADRPDELRTFAAHQSDFLRERFLAESFDCRIEPLSRVLRDEGVERVDLVKIDVQKAELEVLEGIDAEDWPRVRQIVLEVHDLGGRLAAVCELLAARGFTVAAEQDAAYRGTVIHNVYAVRR